MYEPLNLKDHTLSSENPKCQILSPNVPYRMTTKINSIHITIACQNDFSLRTIRANCIWHPERSPTRPTLALNFSQLLHYISPFALVYEITNEEMTIRKRGWKAKMFAAICIRVKCIVLAFNFPLLFFSHSFQFKESLVFLSRNVSLFLFFHLILAETTYIELFLNEISNNFPSKVAKEENSKGTARADVVVNDMTTNKDDNGSRRKEKLNRISAHVG